MVRLRAEFRSMPYAASGLLAVLLLSAAVDKVFFLPVESRLGIFSYPGVVAKFWPLAVVSESNRHD